MYAYFLNLDYFSTECKYAPFAYRGFAREFMKDLERADSTALLKIVMSAEYFQVPVHASQTPSRCVKCGYLSSQRVCKACVLLFALEVGAVTEAVNGKIVIGKDGALSVGTGATRSRTKKEKECGGGCGCNPKSNNEDDVKECCDGDQECGTGACGPEEKGMSQVALRMLRKQQKENGEGVEYARDYPEVMQELIELGLRIKDNEGVGSAKRRIKKEKLFREKQKGYLNVNLEAE